MFSLFDVNGFKGEIGSAVAIKDLQLIAKRLELNSLSNFLKEGFTIEVNKLIKDLESIDVDILGYGELEDQISQIISILNVSSEIVVLTDFS